MSINFTVEPTRGEGSLVRITGSITEDADLRVIAAEAAKGAVQLDLSEVAQINSCGVREWIHLVRELDEAKREFQLVACSPAVVRQLNMISNFRGSGQVRSVLLPYYCESCGTEHHQLLELTQEHLEIPESITCPDCGGEAEFDDLPGSYLTFNGYS